MKLLILSDIHGNWPALEAVLASEPAVDGIVFLGDVVDYGPHPVRCLRWITENADWCVRGNHDNALAYDVECRAMAPSREYSIVTRSWHRGLLTTSDRAALGKMPTLAWAEWQGKHFRLAHATPQGDLFEYLPEERWGECIAGLEEDYVLLGHTHVQGMRRFGRVTVVNPGSVGLARDGGGEACYATFDGHEMMLRRVPYDVERTVADLRAALLPAHVIKGLASVLRGPATSPHEPITSASSR